VCIILVTSRCDARIGQLAAVLLVFAPLINGQRFRGPITMKKLLTSTAFFIALGSSSFAADMPMKAAPQVDPTPLFSGYVGVWGESAKVMEDGGSREVPRGWGADTRLSYWLNPSLSFQLDAETDQLSRGGSVSDPPRREALVVGHFEWRDPRTGSAGLFGGWVYPNDTNDQNSRKDMGIIGLEAQRYFDSVTLYGQGGYLAQFNTANDLDQADKVWFARFAPRYFVTPNDKLAVEIGYAHGEMGDNTPDKMRIINWAATYEHKFDTNPLSVFVQYSGADLKSTENPGDRIREQTVVAGVRWYFNQGTLISNDRMGATYDTPGFIRYLPHVGIAD
jgi:hypothetical protein